MAVVRIELPDGRQAQVDIPGDMSPQDMETEIQAMYEAGDFDSVPAVAVEQPAAQQLEAPSGLEQAAQVARGLNPLSYAKGVASAIQGEVTPGPFGQLAAGHVRGVRDILMGGRQTVAGLMGDQELQAQLEQQEAAQRPELERLTESPIAKVGQVGAQVAPALLGGVGGGVAGAATLGGRIAQVAGTAALGAAGGAAGGATVPLTPEESAAGQRGVNIATGATIGAIAPAATGAAIGAGKILRSYTPKDALSDFVGKVLGRTDETPTLPVFQELKNRVIQQKNSLRSQFDQRYAQLEDNPNYPRVFLDTTSSRAAEIPDKLAEDVLLSLSPVSRNTLSGLKRGATSQIVGPTGEALPTLTTFKDVRTTIRELKAVERSLKGAKEKAADRQQVKRLRTFLEVDLQKWANLYGKTNMGQGMPLSRVIEETKKLDKDYLDKMVPFIDEKNTLGKVASSRKEITEQEIRRMLLSDFAGASAKDLVDRVPGSKELLRNLYGGELLRVTGKSARINQLRSGTVAEALLTKEERSYLAKVANTMEDTKVTSAALFPSLEAIIKRAGINYVRERLGGLQRYGAVPFPEPRMGFGAGAGFGVGQTTARDREGR